MRRSLLLALLLPASAFATDYTGEDQLGANLTLSDGDTVRGTFTNVNVFRVPAGATVTVLGNQPVEIFANEIIIDGVLSAYAAGDAGGSGGTGWDNNATDGEGRGGGDYGRYGPCTYGGGGGGGGFGGAGGDAGYYLTSASGYGGGTHGDEFFTGTLTLGSGGGAGAECTTDALDGANGGGALLLAAPIITIDGEVAANGGDGTHETRTDANGGPGGGSGGMVVLDTCALAGTGIVTAAGGAGGDANANNAGGGGGGGGGRIMLRYWDNSSEMRVQVPGGAAGSDSNSGIMNRNPLKGENGAVSDEVVDIDCDNDGLTNSKDNCPLVSNVKQVDSDGDGIGDLCDACPTPADPNDTDGDGACDGFDICKGHDDYLDTDFDLVPDGCDQCPLDQLNDSDGDGTCDSNDSCPGFNDFGEDLDGDSVADACDNCLGLFNDTQVDSDLDGFGDLCDCGPLDDQQHPDADEICNDQDDNCNGVNDENPTDAPRYYLDADLDGQGNPDDYLDSCDPPGGSYVTNDMDCNDADDDAYIGAEEVCDGVDNDCDGVSDPAELSCDGDTTVEPPLPPREETGCSSTGGLLPSALLVLLAPLAIRRRRS